MPAVAAVFDATPGNCPTAAVPFEVTPVAAVVTAVSCPWAFHVMTGTWVAVPAGPAAAITFERATDGAPATPSPFETVMPVPLPIVRNAYVPAAVRARTPVEPKPVMLSRSVPEAAAPAVPPCATGKGLVMPYPARVVGVLPIEENGTVIYVPAPLKSFVASFGHAGSAPDSAVVAGLINAVN